MPKSKPKPSKAITVGVWLSIDEHASVKAAASKADRTLSNYIRLVLRDKLQWKERAS